MKTEISGNTYPIRNKLNLEGFKWDSEKKLWQKDDINIAQYRKYKRKYKRYKGVKIKIIDSIIVTINIETHIFLNSTVDYLDYIGVLIVENCCEKRM